MTMVFHVFIWLHNSTVLSSLSPMFPLQNGSHNDRVCSHHCSSEQPPLHGSPPHPPSVSETISIHSRLLYFNLMSVWNASPSMKRWYFLDSRSLAPVCKGLARAFIYSAAWIPAVALGRTWTGLPPTREPVQVVAAWLFCLQIINEVIVALFTCFHSGTVWSDAFLNEGHRSRKKPTTALLWGPHKLGKAGVYINPIN